MLTFILGGARSGKSDLAAKLAAAGGRDVLFVATMRELDDEMRARVAAHQAARPPHWRTIQAPVDVGAALQQHARKGEFVIVDCVTAWIANVILDALPDPDAASIDAVAALMVSIEQQTADVIGWARRFEGDVAVVSNDVGAGVVPAYALGRIFRDATGSANKALAAAAGRTLYVIAGLALDLRALGGLPAEAAADQAQ